MRRFVLLIVVLCLSSSLSAGVSYNFSSVTEGAGPQTRMEGKVWVEGTGLRMELKTGDGMLFKNGAIGLSKDGGQTIVILDPKKKTYYELPLAQLLGSLSGMAGSTGGLLKLNFLNPKVTVTPGGAGEPIEGYPTKKFAIDTSYDLIVTVMGFKNETHVVTHSDTWVTEKLGSELTNPILMKGFRTGNQELDALMDAQSKGMTGLPLRQVMKTTTTAKKGKPQVSTTTVNVTGIERVSVGKDKFEVPAGYEESESPMMNLEEMQQPRKRE